MALQGKGGGAPRWARAHEAITPVLGQSLHLPAVCMYTPNAYEVVSLLYGRPVGEAPCAPLTPGCLASFVRDPSA